MHILYITAPTPEIARTISRTLVEEKLVACANILGNITSVYEWEGVIEEGTETALILKTSTSLVEDVISRVKALHPYEYPCIISWEIARGYPDFLNWVENSTKKH